MGWVVAWFSLSNPTCYDRHPPPRARVCWAPFHRHCLPRHTVAFSFVFSSSGVIKAKEIVTLEGLTTAVKTSLPGHYWHAKRTVPASSTPTPLPRVFPSLSREMASARAARLVLGAVLEGVHGLGLCLGRGTPSGTAFAHIRPGWIRAGFFVTFFLEVTAPAMAVEEVAPRDFPGVKHHRRSGL